MKLQLFSTGKELPPQAHPLFADLASCGFPSPAADYVESDLVSMITAYGIRARTYYLRASGDSMADGSLYNGDLLLWTVLKSRARRYRCRQHAGEFTVNGFC
uniref:Error-prone repair protein UmuD n=1 Tax=Klebsiella pneumoniae TaxID=573 RepID=A0A482M751_KLEPN|nr:Error-prone repair protein UmuD [Klebsiella pneumoniae]